MSPPNKPDATEKPSWLGHALGKAGTALGIFEAPMSEEVPSQDPPVAPPEHYGAVSGTPIVKPVVSPDPKITQKLTAALDAAGTKAFTAVFDIFTTTAEDIPDPTARLKMAFKLSKQPAEAVLADLDKLGSVLTEKETVFAREQAARINSTITTRSARLGEIDKENAIQQRDILNIQAEIQSSKDECQKLHREIETESAAIETVGAQFAASINALRAQLIEQRDLISKLGKAK